MRKPLFPFNSRADTSPFVVHPSATCHFSFRFSVHFLHFRADFASFFAYFTVEIHRFLDYNVNLTGKVALKC